MRTLLCWFLLLAATNAWAQDRDDAIFGDDEATTEQPTDAIEERLRAQDNTLQMGGMIYLRGDFFATDGDSIDDHTWNMPNLVDLYLDARPNDRVRAFMRGRLGWNPSVEGETEMGLFGPQERKRTSAFMKGIFQTRFYKTKTLKLLEEKQFL